MDRHVYQIGYDRPIEVWTHLSKNYPDCRLNIHGRKSLSQKYDNLGKDSRIQDSFHFYAPVKNIEEKYGDRRFIANMLKKLIADVGIRKQRGKNARSKPQNFIPKYKKQDNKLNNCPS